MQKSRVAEVHPLSTAQPVQCRRASASHDGSQRPERVVCSCRAAENTAAKAKKSGSQWTLCWREMDSNYRLATIHSVPGTWNRSSEFISPHTKPSLPGIARLCAKGRSVSYAVSAGPFRNRHGVQELASGPRAGQYRFVDLTFTDLRQLADVAAGLRDIILVTGFVGFRRVRRGRRISRAARRARRGYDGLAPEAARERGRLFLAGVGSRTVLFATSAVFDAERDLRLRVGVASGS